MPLLCWSLWYVRVSASGSSPSGLGKRNVHVLAGGRRARLAVRAKVDVVDICSGARQVGKCQMGVELEVAVGILHVGSGL